ncbi:hypothetical protein [Streptomyces sp. G1]|uniref:hypothetical protein n=1 Tax=Streptomyces sp. G1 TaxID=361572 RepID=UPI00202E8B8D|nr:hypothetical protein [Streptomyces sp. G1]MCM1972323.1 hypothetical protein [Streptomyces sp. G1]
MSTPEIRDTRAAYRDALIEEHASYVRAGRTAAAEHVARVLLAEYDHDVTPAAPAAEPEPEPVKETAAAEPAPERAVEAPPVKKTAAARKTTARRPAGN